MEELFPAIVIVIGLMISLFSKDKKATAQQSAADTQRRLLEEQYRAERLAQIEAQHQTRQGVEGRADQPSAPITPTVHTHINPKCDEHDQTGSMNFASTEGADPCHEAQMPPRVQRTEAADDTEAALRLDFTGENLVKAFVMQEVLQRPSQRRMRTR